jgi:hypothetical protein
MMFRVSLLRYRRSQNVDHTTKMVFGLRVASDGGVQASKEEKWVPLVALPILPPFGRIVSCDKPDLASI